MVSWGILVVQHGEKEPGPGDPGLTARGVRQAARTAAWIAGRHRLSRIVSSPMRRAVLTAAAIASATGVPFTTDDRLRERMSWDGEALMPHEEFLEEWRRASADRSYAPRGGDSSECAADRFLGALRELAREAADGDVVAVVTHGGVTVDALRTLLGDGTVRRERPDLIAEGVPCCAVTGLVRDGDGWDVRLPSTTHLTSRPER